MEAQLRSLRLQLDLQAEQLQAEQLQAARLEAATAAAEAVPLRWKRVAVAVGRVSPGRSGAVYAAPDVDPCNTTTRLPAWWLTMCRYCCRVHRVPVTVYPVVRSQSSQTWVRLRKRCAHEKAKITNIRHTDAATRRSTTDNQGTRGSPRPAPACCIAACIVSLHRPRAWRSRPGGLVTCGRTCSLRQHTSVTSSAAPGFVRPARAA